MCHHDESHEGVEQGDFRLATLGILLEPARQGGETAFPAADRPETRHWRNEDWADFEQKCSRLNRCTTSGGLVIKAEKGDAIFWYNVRPEAWGGATPGPHIDPPLEGVEENSMFQTSLHCGAEVIEGEKWWANLWLHPRIPPDPSEQRGAGEL